MSGWIKNSDDSNPIESTMHSGGFDMSKDLYTYPERTDSPCEDFNPLDENCQSLDMEDNQDADDDGDNSPSNSQEFASLDMYQYGVTPPNPRADRRLRDRTKNSRKLFYNLQKGSKSEFYESDIPRKQQQSERMLQLGMLSDGVCIGSDCEQTMDASESGFAENLIGKKKKDTKARLFDREYKKRSLNSYSEVDTVGINTSDTFSELARPLQSIGSSGTFKVESTNRYVSLHPKPVSNYISTIGNRLGMQHSPSIAQLDCPDERLQFYRTFSMLINLGNPARKEKEINSKASAYMRQRSSEQEVWQNRLSDVIWLELQARIRVRSVNDQDNYLCSARPSVKSILEEFMNYRVSDRITDGNLLKPPDNNSTTTDGGFCCGSRRGSLCAFSTEMFGLCLRSDFRHQNTVLVELMQLVERIEFVQSLYPTQKSLARDHQLYASADFQARLGTICLWLNITGDLCAKLHQMKDVMLIDRCENTLWDCVDVNCLRELLRNRSSSISSHSDTALSESYEALISGNEDEDEEGDDGDDEEDDNEKINEKEASLSTEAIRANFQRARQKSVRFNDEVNETNPIESSDSSESLLNTRPPPLLSAANSVEGFSVTSVYRHYVENELKKMGMRKLHTKLKNLLDSSLQRARHALLKQPIVHRGMPEMAPDHCDDLYSHGCSSPQFTDMRLPSFKPIYLFLTRIPLDVMHECLKLRLEQRPKKDPLLLSLPQLIRECKESLHAAVLQKLYFQRMVSDIISSAEHDSPELDMEHYETDMKKTLEVYFDYIQSYMSYLQQLPELSKRLKNFLEAEWNFTKKVCPHIQGGEANAGNRFCLMASSLVRSISDFLETGMDDCIHQLHDTTTVESAEEVSPERHVRSLSADSLGQFKANKSSDRRRAITETCRHFKETFHEARERSSKALGFAKMLRKDLEVAAEFSIAIQADELLKLLRDTGHVRVITPQDTDYLIFIPQCIEDNEEQILQLLNLTCGRGLDRFSDDSSHVSHNEYLLLVKLDGWNEGEEGGLKWEGPIVKVDLTAETTIALIHIEVNGLLLVVSHSNHLVEVRRYFHSSMNDCVLLKSEQISWHQAISDSLAELKNAAIDLREKVANAIAEVDRRLVPDDLTDLEEADKVSIQKLHRETLHQCYNFGFEYHKAVTRLVSGELRNKLSTALVHFANQWMKFVSEKCERGRGIRPRWSAQGMDFLIVACEPRVLATLTDQQFAELKKAINGCITHVIGEKSTNGFNTPTYRMESPELLSQRQMSLLRNPSCPEPARQTSRTLPTLRSSEPSTPFSLQPSRQSSRRSLASTSTMSSSLADPDDDMGIVFMAHPSSASITDLSDMSDGQTSLNWMRPTEDQIERKKKMMKKIRTLEQKRINHLYKEHVVGRPTDKKVDIDYHINLKKVNFKWQRGIKIGEGQFGKVYTAVNMDTGELMAMKEMQFAPNDLQTVKVITDEIKIFEGIDHSNLVHYYGVEVHRDEMIIFMEYCQNGTIEEIAKQGLEEPVIRRYTKEILLAINELHEHGIVHRDIKGANIFLTTHGHVKLGDFGCSVKLKNHTTLPGELKPNVGTPAFMAPEVINNSPTEGLGRAADIWSLGCVVIEMTTGKRPWPELDTKVQIWFKVGMGNIPRIPEKLSEEGQEFLDHIFQKDPQQRWTASQLLRHPFVMVKEEENDSSDDEYD